MVFRYKVGQRFGRHIDESVELDDGRRTYYTLLIYLSGGLKQKENKELGSEKGSSVESLIGGETVFYDSRRGVVAEVNQFFSFFIFIRNDDFYWSINLTSIVSIGCTN